jgi:hypothetical protein
MISASSGRVIQYRAPATIASEVLSDKPYKGDLTNKIAIRERRDFFVFQVMLRSKEAIEE